MGHMTAASPNRGRTFHVRPFPTIPGCWLPNVGRPGPIELLRRFGQLSRDAKDAQRAFADPDNDRLRDRVNHRAEIILEIWANALPDGLIVRWVDDSVYVIDTNADACALCGGTDRLLVADDTDPDVLTDGGACPDCDPYEPTDPATFYDRFFNYRGPQVTGELPTR